MHTSRGRTISGDPPEPWHDRLSRGAPPRLLIQGLNYAPDEIGIPKYTTEMAEWLASRGWDVRVTTAPPYYPAWSVRPGYSGRRYAAETRNGIALLRCPLYVPAKPTGARRLLHLASYAASSTPALLREALRFKPDVVMAVAPALMAAPATLAAARAIRRPALLHVQDFELDMAFGLGLMRGQAARRILTGLERRIYRGFDLVTAPSSAMAARLVEKGCAPERVAEFRNWADTASIHPDVPAAAFRQELGIGPDETMALYSGNLSEKQGASILAAAARILAAVATIRIVICGDGPARDRLAQTTAGLANVTLLPLQPAERLPELLCAADLHLLPQLAQAEDLVLPSKLSGMLASGRPVVATVTPGSGIAREIGRGGIIVPPGDPEALAHGIRRLAGDPALRREAGYHARRRAEDGWAKHRVLGEYESRLRTFAETVRAGSAEHPRRGVTP